MSCWAFLGTLAAAYARAGRFERAVEVQEVSVRLTPHGRKDESEAMLRCFRSGSAFVDDGQPVAAGATISEAEIDEFDDEKLKRALHELLALRGASLH